MIWSYLSQFWNSITSVGDYSVEFFQSIGNAVAGAVGGIFEFVAHNASDFFVFLGWFFSNIGGIFTRLIIPIKFVFNFLKSFLDNAFASPVDTALWSFPVEIKDLFATIPYWNVVGTILGITILIFAGFFIFRKILSL